MRKNFFLFLVAKNTSFDIKNDLFYTRTHFTPYKNVLLYTCMYEYLIRTRTLSTRASRSISLKVVVVVVLVVLVLVVTFCKNLKNGGTSQHRWRIYYMVVK